MRLQKVSNPILKSCRRRLQYKVSITCDVAKRRYSCELSKLLTDTIEGQHIYNIDSKDFRAIVTHLKASCFQRYQKSLIQHRTKIYFIHIMQLETLKLVTLKDFCSKLKLHNILPTYCKVASSRLVSQYIFPLHKHSENTWVCY